VNYRRRSVSVVGVDETWLEGVVVGAHVAAAEAQRGERALATQSAEGTQRWVLSVPPPHHCSAQQAALEWQLAHLAY